MTRGVVVQGRTESTSVVDQRPPRTFLPVDEEQWYSNLVNTVSTLYLNVLSPERPSRRGTSLYMTEIPLKSTVWR